MIQSLFIFKSKELAKGRLETFYNAVSDGPKTFAPQTLKSYPDI